MNARISTNYAGVVYQGDWYCVDCALDSWSPCPRLSEHMTHDEKMWEFEKLIVDKFSRPGSYGYVYREEDLLLEDFHPVCCGRKKLANPKEELLDVVEQPSLSEVISLVLSNFRVEGCVLSLPENSTFTIECPSEEGAYALMTDIASYLRVLGYTKISVAGESND